MIYRIMMFLLPNISSANSCFLFYFAWTYFRGWHVLKLFAWTYFRGLGQNPQKIIQHVFYLVKIYIVFLVFHFFIKVVLLRLLPLAPDIPYMAQRNS